jgi:hypothetical protein
LKALSLGVFGDCGVSDSPDYSKAYEGIAIVSERMREVINGISDSNVTYFALPNVSSFLVAVPNRVFFPSPNDPSYDVKNLCSKCGRFRNVVWGTERPRSANRATSVCFGSRIESA